MNRLSFLGATLLVGATGLLAACGNPESVSSDTTAVTNLAFVDESVGTATTSTTLIAAAPDVRLSEADTALVRFEASWICEVQRRTFPTQEGRQEALEQKLTDSGMTLEDYEAFRARVNDDRGLRDSILFTYQETCRA